MFIVRLCHPHYYLASYCVPTPPDPRRGVPPTPVLEDLLGLLEPLGLAELVEEGEAPNDLGEPARGPPGT